MATIQQQLNQLQQDKQSLVNNLTEKGITATNEETFTELVPKVLDIETGGGDISEYFETIITPDNYNNFGNNYFIKKTPTITIADDVTSASYLFSESSFLKEINIKNTKNIKKMNRMFDNCKNLIKVNSFDTSNVTNMEYMFSGCYNILEIPEIDTSKVTDMDYIFNYCEKITKIPKIDTSNVTEFSFAFSDCKKIKEIPELNTPKVVSFYGTFKNCYKLVKIPQLDFGSCYTLGGAFQQCSELTTVGGLLNVGKNYSTNQSENYYNFTIDFSYSSKLTLESANNIIDNLYDIASIGVKPQRLKFNSAVLSQIPEEKIAVATQKGWTVTS